MPHQTITISTPQAEKFSGYLSLPKSDKAPGIVLIQEIFGVNQGIREAADHFAAAGYTVLAPDVFWRFKPNLELTDQGKDLEEAYDYYHRFDWQQGVKDLSSAVEALRHHPSCNGKVAVLGFCFGGKMAYLTAAHHSVDAIVAFYGGGIADYLAMAKNIQCPVLMHFGAEDEMIPEHQVEMIQEAFAGHPNVEIDLYPGVAHAFFNHRRANYNEAAAKLAYQRTVKFLQRYL